MGLKEQYASVKQKLLGDESICEENRELFVFGRRHGAWKIIRYRFNKSSA